MNIHRLKYQKSTASGFEDKGIENSEFVTKTQFLCKRKNDLDSNIIKVDTIIKFQLKNMDFHHAVNLKAYIYLNYISVQIQTISKGLVETH